jgi:hypothetical protein
MAEDLLNRDCAAVQAGGDERGNGFREIEGVDLVECQLAVLEQLEQFSIGAAASAEELCGQGTLAGLTQMKEEQYGEDGFANTGIGASDENESRGWHGCFSDG